MENRTAYLRTALQLRSGQGVVDVGLHPHSRINRRMALGLVESDIYSTLNMSYMSAWAAISSHEKLDIKASLKGFDRIYNSVRKTIPYMRREIVDTGVDEVTQKLIDRWKELNERGELEPEKGKE